LSKFLQEFVWWDIEGILLKDPADDDHRMGPHDIDYLVATELSKMVGANNRVFVTTPHIIHSRLELNEICEMGLIFARPVHTTTNSTQRISSGGVAADELFKRRDHAIRIEATIRKVDVRRNAKLQLPALQSSRRVDPNLGQTPEMILTLIWIHNVDRFVATLESILYEWEQDAILFVRVVEESADMARFGELGTSERNGSRVLLHRISLTGSRDGAPVECYLIKDAPLRPQMSNRYFGIDRYVRPIDSSSHFWLNQTGVIGGVYEHCIGIEAINEQRTNRTEEL
jgi:hypothetical protein